MPCRAKPHTTAPYQSGTIPKRHHTKAAMVPPPSSSVGAAGKKRRRPGPPAAAAASARGELPPQPAGQSKTEKKKQPSEQKVDGVPPSLTPLLLHAVKARRRYLSKLGCGSESANALNEELAAASRTSGNDGGSGDVLSQVAARARSDHDRQQALQADQSSAGDPQSTTALRHASDDATKSFLNGVQREATTHQRRRNGSSSGGGASGASVPEACLTFLLELFVDDEQAVKLNTRRAALALAGDLLKRSAECRASFATAERLKQYVEVVGGLAAAGAGALDQLKSTVQREAADLLQELSGRFGSHYPRLVVAGRYLSDKGIVVGTTSMSLSTTPSNSRTASVIADHRMDDLRKGRDSALKYGEKECAKVRKLLNKADACFEILVPRMGTEQQGSAGTTIGKESAEVVQSWADDDGDSENDIDWEEGDDLDADDASSDHEAAVERTLAQMEKSRGLDQGELEIHLHGRSPEDQPDTSADAGADAVSAAAFHSLGRTIDLLSKKHMPRLAFWVDCLISADGMMVQSQEQNASVQSSLVVMPSSLWKKRADTLNAVMSLRSEAAKALTSAVRIGIQQGDENRARDGAHDDESSIPPPNSSTGSNVHGSPSSSNRNDLEAFSGAARNSTGVGIATNPAALDPSISWQKALGVKTSRPKAGDKSARDRISSKAKRRLRLGPAARSTGIQLKLRKGL